MFASTSSVCGVWCALASHCLAVVASVYLPLPSTFSRPAYPLGRPHGATTLNIYIRLAHISPSKISIIYINTYVGIYVVVGGYIVAHTDTTRVYIYINGKMVGGMRRVEREWRQECIQDLLLGHFAQLL